ncbi:MAG: caspase family protein [Phormidesmis sp.]
MKRYALVIGISDYSHSSLLNLLKPKTDAEAMRDVLQADNNFEVTLLNERVTRDRLKDALETLLLKRGKNSDVLIYFTGHGFTAGEDEDEAQGYLATQDCQIEKEGKRVLSARRGFSFQALNKLIAKAELSSLVLLLDCCHSGSFIESARARETLGALDTHYFLVAACRSFEQAAAMKAAENSIFSAAVLAALRADEARITGMDVLRRVAADLQGTGQEPLYLGAGSDIPILERRVAAVAVVSEECPYQGLKAFTPETAEFFFGREDEVAELCMKLRRSDFVPVLGPSGSGKSSVVRAGLVTRLRTEGWQEVTMKPGKQPMVELERVLRQFFEGAGFSMGRVRDVLVSLGFGEAFPQELGQLDQADIKLLLIVDQFEEVFTLCEDKAAQRAFIRRLFYLGEVGASRVKVVMTMRSDFVDNWLAAGLSRSPIAEDTVWLGVLQGENLAAVIEQPAQKQGYAFEAGLLKLLLIDVEKEENCLPLLEFALTGLWDRRETQAKKLTVSAYEEMGGLTGVLNRQATAVYENLREVDRPWAKRICLSLVRVGREDKDTRQRQPKEVLLNMGGVAQRRVIADVIADLVKGRLLVSDGDVVAEAAYVDVAHEALLEGWEQFAAWRQEDRDLLRLEQRLKDAYEDWQAKEAGEEREKYLLTGGLLAEVREQRAVLSERLSDSRPTLMKYFADSDQKNSEAIATLQQALADANVRAEAIKVRDKLLNNPAQTVDATLSAIALVGSSQQYFRSKVVFPAQDALHRAWLQVRERLRIEGHSHFVYSVAFSPDGERIISGSADCTLRLWDLKGNAIGKPFKGHSSSVYSVAFSPDGAYIVSGSDDNTLRLWDLEGNSVGCPFEGHSSMVYAVAFSPRGDRIVSGSTDNTLRLWDLEGNSVGSPFEGHHDSVYTVAFSPRGDRIISGSTDNTLRLWDLEGNSVSSILRTELRGYKSVVAEGLIVGMSFN